MKLIPGILALFLICTNQTLGQVGSPSEKWAGTWILDKGKSSLGTILFPGTPDDLEIISQALRIEVTDTQVRLSGETSVKTAGQIALQKDDTTLSLDGTQRRIGPASLVLHPIDAYTFEIVSSMQQAEREYREISRFAFSKDRTALTETKTQTARAIASDATPKARDEVMKFSTSTLVFSRKP